MSVFISHPFLKLRKWIFLKSMFIWRKWNKPAAHWMQPAWEIIPKCHSSSLCVWYLAVRQLDSQTAFCYCPFRHYFSWWKSYLYCSSLIILWHQTKTLFIWLCVFIGHGEKKNKKNHTHSFSTQCTKRLHWATDHLLTITKMNRTIRQTKRKQHLFLFDLCDLCSAGLHSLQGYRSLALEPSHSARTCGKARFQSLPKFSSRIPWVLIQFPF